jgi:precorrin-6B C5,15-methyltransferase / cobalt-precorrin-6B C5,C15-methyltransferase
MHQLYVVGMGLDGPAGLATEAKRAIEAATVIAGSAHHLKHFSSHPAEKLTLGSDIEDWLSQLKKLSAHQSIVVLASGDPLFFGIGRLLTEHFPSEILVFYPHVSSVQLAFSRLQIPWQSATIVSIHGRSIEPLEQALKKGAGPIAVLTDGIHTPVAIAQLIKDLRLPIAYRLWVCSQLGGAEERVESFTLEDRIPESFPMPNVVVLQQIETSAPPLPLLGIPDSAFYTFPDQPGLITKQEVRVLSLSLLQLMPQVRVWDIGAGTGSISIEVGRLVPDAQIFAVEQTAVGTSLIRRNCERLGVKNVQVVSGAAPKALINLPDPDRIVLGGGGARIAEILAVCMERLKPGGVLVGNFATIEALYAAQTQLRTQSWSIHLLQVNLARSTAIGEATRFVPMNPVTLLQAIKPTG